MIALKQWTIGVHWGRWLTTVAFMIAGALIFDPGFRYEVVSLLSLP